MEKDKKYTVKPALCLDFDGTIRRSKSGKTFIQDENDIELMPGIEEKIWEYRNKGFLIFGVSNQAGVAHGFKTKKQVKKEMLITQELFKENPFNSVRWCISDAKGKDFPYNYRSLCRKPNIGSLALLENEFKVKGIIVDWDNSLFVGDRPEDEECSYNAGITFMHIDEFLKK